MIFRVIYHETFWDEVLEATQFLASQRPAAAQDFGEELAITLTAIIERPYSFRVLQETARRALLTKFSYKLIFEVDSDTVYVVGLAHTARDISAWLRRKQSP